MIPIRLSMNNFYSHSNSEIDFSDFNSCLIIGNTEGDYSKSNGSGKSVIFESILWCLFNKSRSSMMDDIILWGENSCSVELIFSHFDDIYKVVRVRNRASSTSSVEIFKESDDGGWANVSGSVAGATNKIIESIICLDHKTFVNSVYFRQNDISEFTDSEPGRRKEILKNIIDVSRWDEYEKDARTLLRALKKECVALESLVTNYESEKGSNNSMKESLSLKKDGIKAAEIERKTTQSLILNLKEEYSKIKESLDTDSYDKIVDEISLLKKSGTEKKRKLEEADSLIAKYSAVCESVGLRTSNLTDKISGLKYTDDISSLIKSLRDRLISGKSDLESSIRMREHVGYADISGDSCYICDQKIDKGLHDKLINDAAEKVSLYDVKIDGAALDIEKINSSLDLRNNDKKNNDLIDSVGRQIKPLNLEMSIAKENLISLSEDKRALVESMIQIKSDIEYKNKILDSLKNDTFQGLAGRIVSLKDSRSELNELISSLSKDTGALSERIKMSDDAISSMDSGAKKLGAIRSEVVILENIVKMLGKSGIQTILLDTIIEDLEGTSNKILNYICNEPSSISLETQRTGADGTSIVETLDIKINIDGVSHGFKSLSGGEKFRIALALRIALSEISSRHGNSALEFLLLDEINSPLDRHGTNTLFVGVIKALEEKYKILVITHDESLKEKFGSVIDVTKINGESSIEFRPR